MDPISHGLIGAGVAALSGQPLAWDNPVYLGTILGSMAPDLDIVMQVGGHVNYLKHHRGVSHSLPGLVCFSLIISLGLYAVFPHTQFWTLLAWTFAGSLSHSLFDLLNSYGAKIFWPFIKRRISINSIIVSDPIILAAFMLTFLHNINRENFAPLAFAVSLLYIIIRWRSKCDVVKLVKRDFGEECCAIMVFPALYKPFSWNFAVDMEDRVITGSVPFGQAKLVVKNVLSKSDHPSIETVEDSPLGEIFRDFTPYYHVSHIWQDGCQVVQFSDLRYQAKKGFLHTGTAILDKDGEVMEEVFEPYNARKRIRIA